MRKIIATIAALGFLGTTSLTPVLAASIDGTAPSNDLSAAAKKKKKKAAPKEEKKTELLSSDVSAAAKKKKKKAAPKEEKKSSIILYRIAA